MLQPIDQETKNKPSGQQTFQFSDSQLELSSEALPPGHELVIANIKCSMVPQTEEQESGRFTGIDIDVLHPERFQDENNVVGKIRIRDFDHPDGVVALLETFYREAPEESDTQSNSSQVAVIPEALIERILKEALQFNATLRCDMGRDIQQILRSYRHRCEIKPLRDATVVPLEIDELSHKAILKPLSQKQTLQPVAEKITWVDIDTPACDGLRNSENVEQFIFDLHPRLFINDGQAAPIKEKDFITVDFRIFEEGVDDCSVARRKLYILLGESMIVTLHDNSLETIETVRRKFLANEYAAILSEDGKQNASHRIGAGFVFARILEDAVEHNERVLRQVENTGEYMIQQLDAASPAELKTIVADIAKFKRTTRFIERKTAEPKNMFRLFRSMLDKKHLEGTKGNLSKEAVLEKLEALQGRYDELAMRAQSLSARAAELGNLHETQVNLHSNRVQTRLALLGAGLGPPLTAMTLIEILPTIQEMPGVSTAVLVTGAACSVVLIAVGKISKMF